jgi:hypothetical protein
MRVLLLGLLALLFIPLPAASAAEPAPAVAAAWAAEGRLTVTWTGPAGSCLQWRGGFDVQTWCDAPAVVQLPSGLPPYDARQFADPGHVFAVVTPEDTELAAATVPARPVIWPPGAVFLTLIER